LIEKKLFLRVGKLIVKITKEYYEHNNTKYLPRNIMTRQAFLNSMTLDIAMGGSTNTVLHLLAAAQEGNIDFKMSDIDFLSRRTPNLCKLSPNTALYHIEDLHRAGGVMGILNELDKINLLYKDTFNILGLTLKKTLCKYNILTTKSQFIKILYAAAPSGKKTIKPFSQSCRWKSLDTDRKFGCIRSYDFCFSLDGGLAVLYGNIAKNGCIVKTAGVDKKYLKFRGRAVVYESQEDAVFAILNNKVVKGNVIVIRYEGPKGGPGMQEMLYPTSYLKSVGLDKDCALITDGRFSGGTSGLSIGHVSPEAASKGAIALIQTGDYIDIDIPNRTLNLDVTDEKLLLRMKDQENRGKYAYKPNSRNRVITTALKIYAEFATSADQGAVRSIYKN